MNKRREIKSWTIRDTIELYGIENWGRDYFRVLDSGEVAAVLDGKDGQIEKSLYGIVQGLRDRGIGMPVLLRFEDILHRRVEYLNKSFLNKMKEYNYTGGYRAVYPIKVNQQEQVIKDIAMFGSQYAHGLEAGSKAELMVALAYVHSPDALVICNGYKDEEFVDLALYGKKVGLNVFIVVERPGELKTIIARSKALGILPNIGLRVKLSSTVSGKWSDSAGDFSVFGLSASQMLDAVAHLRKEGMLDCLRLLHYHLGSQIPDIKSIRAAVGEACRYYAAIVAEGAPMGYLDIGGGLAVDYDGSKTNFAHSRNYSLSEYCSDVVDVVMAAMNEEKIAHPVIVSESGRALVAYSSVLIFNILDVNNFSQPLSEIELPQNPDELLKNLRDVYGNINMKNLQEMYHDALYYRDEARTRFLGGEMSLRDRGLADQLFWQILIKLSQNASQLRFIPEELEDLQKIMVSIYYGNFSVFQSIPDSWAIDQLFPIMPLHRLKEKPDVPAIIADTTCDCDGKIDRFVDLYDVKSYIPLHPINPDEEYYIGVFLVGAYQETLGDLHNLFGDTHVISIRLDENGEVLFSKEIDGDSVGDVLSYVEYSPKDLVEDFKSRVEAAVRQKRITPNERKDVMRAYEEGMNGYTYFEM
ncbi:MAG: biosynthetic arginine decarboxylase [Spirochaetaceae bacterium]|nr:MAG: biosynthetic arginine decarboxylase [Spirochaetaceae bacterium]